MSEIKIVEKKTAPHVCWAQIVVDQKNASLERCAYKVVFDRTYPYFWVWLRGRGNIGGGLALTYDDVYRAAVFDDTGVFNKFSLESDGILRLESGSAVCIAMGPRQAFYIVSNDIANEHGGLYNYCISAQEDPVCPFVAFDPYV